MSGCASNEATFKAALLLPFMFCDKQLEKKPFNVLCIFVLIVQIDNRGGRRGLRFGTRTTGLKSPQ